ncbi:MAG: AraC family transcriptional regulator [Bacteroidaceae bacterium]|nr:AraC family transcriptional regulator [Bacteroidaceae bacterium]
MKELDTNSLKYLTVSSNDINWGLVVTTVGRQSIAPNTHYPIMQHPDAYYFKPAKGRVLNEFQIVYIYEGGGFFESHSIPRQRIEAGTVILLFPGERHSYEPDEHSGWSEYWIGFRGGIANNLLSAGFFSAKEALLKIGLSSSLMGLYRDAIRIAAKESVGSQQLLSGVVMHMLGHILYRHKSSTDCANRTEDIVNEARQLMRERVHHSLRAEDIANALGVGYSWFRQSFRRVTGVSPAQYISLLLICRAKEMLVSEHKTISETAYALGFESVGQFSTLFRKVEGITPRQFREGNRLTYSDN